MEWYGIIGFVVLWFMELYLTGKFYEQLRDRGIMGVGGIEVITKENAVMVSFLNAFDNTKNSAFLHLDRML